MKSKILLTFAAAAMLSLTGCQSGSSNTAAANEELLKQIEQLQQQVQDLEEKITAEENAAPENIPPAPDDSADAGAGEQEAAPAVSPDPETASSGNDSSAGLDTTTRTIEELTDTVSAFETKVDSIVPASSSSESMEQFLTLKQEEKTIDNELDLHEDELEELYRQGTLSRDDYKARERELERLEDRLDDVEDKLEYTFGIDD